MKNIGLKHIVRRVQYNLYNYIENLQNLIASSYNTLEIIKTSLTLFWERVLIRNTK